MAIFENLSPPIYDVVEGWLVIMCRAPSNTLIAA